MPNDPKTNEWNLLKQQFDALLHDENVSADSIEEVLDVEFRRRFAELIYLGYIPGATVRCRRCVSGANSFAQPPTCLLLAQSRHSLLHRACPLLAQATWATHPHMSVVGGKADMPYCGGNVCF
jgi:hypothetical protein